MWRKWCYSASLLNRRLLANGVRTPPLVPTTGTLGLGGVSLIPSTAVRSSTWLLNRVALYSSSVDSSNSAGGAGGDGDKSDGGGPASKESGAGNDRETISFTEAKRLMRLVNVEALKMKLGTDGKEAIGYSELLEACESMGVARSHEEAAAFARVLDEAGVILLFRDKVYLHPDKVGKTGGGGDELFSNQCISS